MFQRNFLSHHVIFFILFSTFSLSACDIEIDNNLPDIPPEGRFAVLGANQHTGISSAEVAIAIFDDATPVSLVGGDVVQASTSEDSVLLLKSGVYNGSYAASLPNSANFDQVDFLMVHEPLEARQGRWYPVDLLNIDPGPGEFVGASASILLPPLPLNLQTDVSNFMSINDGFTLSWTPETAGDIMKVRSAVSCTNQDNTYTYGTEAALTDGTDDGSEIIGLQQFIYDLNDPTPPPFEFLLGESRAALQELLNKLIEKDIAEDFFNSVSLVNPIDSRCEIRLFLFRHRDGAFDSVETNGRIFGSRSADVTLFYNPN